jgi:hypothetical protein
MCFTLTSVVSTDAGFQFVCPQQPVRFGHRPLAMHPFRLNRVKPRTFAGQLADHEAHADRAPFDLLIVLAQLVSHRMAAVPGRVVPEQQQSREALRRELGGAPRQKGDRHRTDGAPRHEPEPHLVRLLRPRPQQQPITGQRLGIGIIRGRREFLQLLRGLCVCPAMLIRLGEPAPPDFVATAQGPGWLGQGQPDQPVASFFSRA